jgi:hypothetical protein
MAIIKKYSPFQNLSKFQTFLVDENPNSDYFGITELKDTFTGGKNGFLIEGSPFLKETTEVKIEILDVEGNPIYFEPGDGSPEYYEGLSKLVSVHVYDDTPIGIGKITILGELKEYVNGNGSVVPIPSDWAGVYNVKWEKSFKINKNISNEDIVRFYKRPIVQIDELVKPIFTKTVQTTTDNVEVTGIPQQPIGGTDLSSWRAGTLYKLIRASGSWDVDVDENIITVSLDNGGTYSPTIIEVLNDKEVLVDVPYTENNLVSSFVSQSSSVTYQDFEGEEISESALTGSFAKIDLYQLKTFVGDVARVKVFRKSRNEVGDFQFVQESRLESTELLRDITTSQNTEISYGRFSEDNLSNYWVTSSNDHPVTVDSSVLSQAIKVDYNGSGVQKLETLDSFTLSKDVEYELAFRTLLSGSAESDKYVKAYFSGSYTNNLGNPASYIQTFMHVSGSDIYKTRQNVSQNILAERDIDAKLVFEFKGDDWYVSNVSLRNAQETSFSPDEFTLIQDIPRKLPAETFDFRFEFYDINNNYIPVDVKASKEFTGGNSFPTSGKLLTFESDRNAFRYSSGSANPENQQIKFSVTSQNLTGSVLYDWNAFDINGSYITENGWGAYPGELTNPNNAGALLTVSNFEGTWTGSGDKPEVYSITYTASREDLEEFETVYRLEDGDNAPTLLVTSNANQFIYEPTTLSPKPSGQSITIRAQRKNLASLSTPITVNKSNPNGPNLTEVSDANGIKTYSISATQFSSSFAESNFDEITYSFTGSDVFGDEQTDEITISKVINFDGVSIVLSTENTSFKSDSTGTITSAEFDKGDGTVDVRVGSFVIAHDDAVGGTTKNTFDIVSATPSTGLTANSLTPTTNSYGISAMSEDSGTLTLLIRYKAGDGSTTVDFNKVVNYSKSKIAAPVLSIETTNKDQSITAKSTGEQIDSFVNSTVTVVEQYEGQRIELDLDSLTAVASTVDIGTVTTNNTTGVISLSSETFANSTNTSKVLVTAEVTDSEGTSRTLTDNISLSKIKNAAPSVTISATPQSQNVKATTAGVQTGTLTDVTVTALEGNTDVFDDMEVASSSGFDSTPTISSNTLTLSDRTLSSDEGTVTLTVNYTDTEGTSGSQSITIRAIKSSDGNNGEPGSSGVVISLSPTSQTVKVATNGTYDTPSIFTVIVSENGIPLTHTTNPTLANNQFKIGTITNGSISAGSGTTTPDIQPTTPSLVTGLTTSFTITYKDSQGNESDPLPQTHLVSVVLDGVTGPGVVHTGVWEEGRIYQFDDGLLTGTGRRDSVLWSTSGNPPYDTYYASNRTHTSVGTNTANGAPHETNSTAWTSLGTQDFFVAAKIGIFEESFVQNTLNIGTNEQGGFSAANITLYGGGEYPYFSLGQATAGVYGDDGIFIGNDSGNYRMSLVGDDGFLKWNGTSLEIEGNITITNPDDFADPDAEANPSDYAFGGTGFDLRSETAAEGLNLNADFLGYHNGTAFKSYMDKFGNFYLSGTNQGLSWNAGTDTLIINGEINITNPDDFADPDAEANPDNYSFGPSALFDLTTFTPSTAGLYLGSTNMGYYNGGWKTYMDDDGNFFLSGTSNGLSWNAGTDTLTVNGQGNFTGTVTAGGVQLGPDLRSTDDGLKIDDDNFWYNAGTVRFQVGNSDASFKISNSGNLQVNVATGAAMSFYNTTNGTQGMTLAPGQIYLVPSGAGSGDPGNLNVGRGTISGDVTSGYLKINPTTAVEIDGDLDVTGDINADGNITAFASSDKKLKDNIIPISNPLEKIIKIGGYEFDWNENQTTYEGHDIGVIAQEIQEVLPEVVTEKKDGYLGVRYEKIVPLLIEGIKELTNKVESLEQEIFKLKEKK